LWYSNYQVKDKEKCLPAGKMGSAFFNRILQGFKIISYISEQFTVRRFKTHLSLKYLTGGPNVENAKK